MLLFLSILGILLSVILLIYNARKNGSTIYRGFFFLLISLYGFYQYVLLYSKSVLLVEILLAGFAIVFLAIILDRLLQGFANTFDKGVSQDA